MGYRYGENTEKWKGKENSEMETNTEEIRVKKLCHFKSVGKKTDYLLHWVETTGQLVAKEKEEGRETGRQRGRRLYLPPLLSRINFKWFENKILKNHNIYKNI